MDRSKLTEEQEIWLKHIPQYYRSTYVKAASGKSKKAAIKAKCQDCSNWQRVEVKKCQLETCPLFPYRPYR